jgi:hypothetical protein
MADVKISALPASTTPLAGTEVLPIVQGGATKQVAVSNLTVGRAVTASNFTASTGGPAFDTQNQGTNAARYQASNTGGIIYMGLDSSGGGLTVPYALNIYHSGAYPICFATNNSEKMRIFSSGGVSIGNTTDPGASNLKVTGGVLLGTSTTPLSDYAEGTWTPTDTSGAGLAITVGSANYVKTGKMVLAQFYITYPANSDVSGASITLPFPPQNVYQATAIVYTNSTATMLAVNPGSTSANLYTGIAPIANVTLAGKFIICNFVYYST